ncbi:MAG: hypothetical protein ACRDQ5_14465 [Sciscionella sp.]
MIDIHQELAIQYALMRREYPRDDAEKIAKRVTARLDEHQRLVLAEEAMIWSDEAADREELALAAVRNFVLAMETDTNE